MKNNYFTGFILCGIIGWSLECFWTGLCNLVLTPDPTLPCQTSLWMFPIYGMAAFIFPLSQRLSGRSIFLRGFIYTGLIFLTEFLTGSLLTAFHACPWDYSQAKFQFRGVIRFDYAPLWFICGLLFEHLLSESYNRSAPSDEVFKSK